MDIRSAIREIPDFPSPGILFYDVTTLMKDPVAYKQAIDMLVDSIKDLDVDVAVGPEARGFVVCAPLAYAAGLAFVPARKPGKLPAEVVSYEYELEYGTDKIEIHKDAIKPGDRVIIADDLLATGGTAEAALRLVEEMGGVVVGLRFFIELSELKGRERFAGYDVKSLITY